MMKDLIGTVLALHSLTSLIVNHHLTFGFVVFVVCLGIVVGVLGTYLAVLKQQLRLIEEIKTI